MDSESRSKLAWISEEDWENLGFLPEPNQGLKSDFQQIQGPDNDVHPLFQRTNAFRPAGQEYIWRQHMSESKYREMYRVLGPSIQLASQILGSPRSLEFLYQVAYSSKKTPKGQLSTEERPCKEFGWPGIYELPQKKRREWAINALSNLAHSLSFEINDAQSSMAFTDINLRPEFKDGARIDDTAGRPGLASVITINQDYFDMLLGLDTQEGDTTAQMMNLQLKLAITLCHEVSVSIRIADKIAMCHSPVC